MERIAFDIEGSHFGVADFDAFGIGVGVQFAADRETGFGRGGGDQLDNRRAARQRSAPPVLRDMTEQAVLDPVPFRSAGRIVADL